jgi:glycosyltransferase involved in cell wall biosynthesis
MKTSLIVPAYNEELYIKPVLEAAKKGLVSGLIHEIIVVDDGSEDKTAEISQEFATKMVKHQKNEGKGAAINSGIKISSGEIILLIDADLVNLNEDHFRTLLLPIINEEAGMTIGVFKKTSFYARFGNLIPDINGQRAFKREWAMNIRGMEKSGYGVDRLLTRRAKFDHLKIMVVPLFGLSQVYKETKKGFKAGFQKRIRMYREVITMTKIEDHLRKVTKRRK